MTEAERDRELNRCDTAIEEIRAGKYGLTFYNALGEADWECEKQLIHEEYRRTNDCS